MKIGLIQSNPQDSINDNLTWHAQLIVKAANQGCHVVVLPEMFSYMGDDQGRLKTANHLADGVFKNLCDLAKNLKIYLVAGSHSELSHQDNKVYNTAVTLSPAGKIISSYRKIHLFNLRDPDGNKLYCESDIFLPGEKLETFSIADPTDQSWIATTIICYDLRFPETLRNLKTRMDIVFIPAAFTHQTGEAHWEVLNRARAIENQCYVVACNQTGFFAENKKRNYGHSMVVDPWGNIVGTLGEETGLLIVELDRSKIQLARTKLPALDNRVL